MTSFYTCKLLVQCTGNDADFCITLDKYYGRVGYYLGLAASTVLLIGAITVLFIILA